MTSQTITVYYRTGFDQDFALITNADFNGTFTGDGTTNAYQITNNNIGAVQFIQLRIEMATGGSNLTYTPQLKTITLS